MKSARCGVLEAPPRRTPVRKDESGALGVYKTPEPQAKRSELDLDALKPLFDRLQPGVAPNWTLRYKVGALVARTLDTCCTLEELGQALGVTKQNAYTESVVALGALVCELYVRMHYPRVRKQAAPACNH